MFFVTKQLNRIEKHANTSENTVFLSVIFLREDSLHFNYAYTATVSRIVNLKSKIVSNSPENRTETYRKVILKFCKFTRRVVLTKPTYVTQKKKQIKHRFFQFVLYWRQNKMFSNFNSWRLYPRNTQLFTVTILILKTVFEYCGSRSNSNAGIFRVSFDAFENKEFQYRSSFLF